MTEQMFGADNNTDHRAGGTPASAVQLEAMRFCNDHVTMLPATYVTVPRNAARCNDEESPLEERLPILESSSILIDRHGRVKPILHQRTAKSSWPPTDFKS